MNGGKELKALLDILALDSSVYARIQVGVHNLFLGRVIPSTSVCACVYFALSPVATRAQRVTWIKCLLGNRTNHAMNVLFRFQATRAFSKLRWNDPRVLRSLKEREKGGGVLAKYEF